MRFTGSRLLYLLKFSDLYKWFLTYYTRTLFFKHYIADTTMKLTSIE